MPEIPYRFTKPLPLLSEVFPPAPGSGILQPQWLDQRVNLVHDLLGTAPYLAVSIYDLLGAAGVTSIVQAVAVPSDQVWIIDELGIYTDDTVARAMTLWIHYINAAGDFAVPAFSQNSDTSARWWPIPKRLVLPPMGKLELSVPAITAGKVLRFTAAYLALPAGQFCPRS